MTLTTDQILQNVIDDIRRSSQQALTSGHFRGEGRGQFRQELVLTTARVAALHRGQRLEEVLERLIVAVMSEREVQANVCWWNQLAVTAGVIQTGNRVAADLGRRIDDAGRVEIDVVELKAWNAHDTAQELIEQVLWYGYALAYLRKQSVPPYQELANLHVRLAMMAPAAYFEADRRAQDLVRLIPGMQESIERARKRYPELAMLSMCDRLIVLDGRMEAARFVGCFGEVAGEVKNVVTKKQDLQSLRDWIADAFGQAGF
ncbi:MAG: hypothetical protein KBD01_13820 [Acidobacteria bacterium]|nr:hypothetical protein [Acidobacteriota bacterium]